jgi:hypothetical protein
MNRLIAFVFGPLTRWLDEIARETQEHIEEQARDRRDT